jgi:hypothetical protein
MSTHPYFRSCFLSYFKKKRGSILQGNLILLLPVLLSQKQGQESCFFKTHVTLWLHQNPSCPKTLKNSAFSFSKLNPKSLQTKSLKAATKTGVS